MSGEWEEVGKGGGREGRWWEGELKRWEWMR